MIKLFRNSRQTQMNSGNKMSYLAYALGEIVLVVIGILIAVGINNLNQNRIDRKAERKILTNLVAEIDYNTKSLETEMTSADQKLDAINWLLQIIKDRSQHTKDEILLRFALQSRVNSLQEQTTIFEEITSTGRVDLIGEDLRLQIIEYYQFLRKTKASEINNNDWYISGSFGTILNDVDYNSLVHALPLDRKIVEVDGLDISLFEKDLNDPQLKRFINNATFHYLITELMLRRYTRGMEMSQEVKASIEDYLAK